MPLSFFVEPFDAQNYRRLMNDGDVAFLRMRPTGRLPTMPELREVLASFDEFEVEYNDVGDGWQIDVYNRQKPSSELFAFISTHGKTKLSKLEIADGAPELYLAIVFKLSEKVGPLVLFPRPPLVASSDLGLPFLMRNFKDYLEEIKYCGPPEHLPRSQDKEVSIKFAGRPILLNAGTTKAVLKHPAGFQSKFTFAKTDLAPRIKAISWFAECGKPLESLQLTMPVRQVSSWVEATKTSKARKWNSAQTEAQNQLTVFLHTHAHSRYQRWNHFVKESKQEIIGPAVKQPVDIAIKNLGLDSSIRDCATWDILGALMENAYLDCRHSALFFLELLRVYEAEHFPCGWEGKWPKGTLLVF